MDAADRERKRAWRAEAREKGRLALTWSGRLVGWIDEVRYDFPHHYGRWVGTGEPLSSDFLAALRRAVDADDGIEVIVGESERGTVYVHPDDNQGEIDVRQDAG